MKSRRVTSVVLLVSFAISGMASAQINVSSSAFESGGAIPAQFTCKGANFNPPLRLEGLPREAKSLVLIVDDPDAPGGLFSHWLVWNIVPDTTEIGAKSVPTGAAQGTNDFGKAGYNGPCPPSGTHHYYFRVFALDRKLDLQSGAKRSALESALKNHVLARGSLMGRFTH